MSNRYGSSLHKNPTLYRPGPPLAAIDRFLGSQGNFADHEQENIHVNMIRRNMQDEIISTNNCSTTLGTSTDSRNGLDLLLFGQNYDSYNCDTANVTENNYNIGGGFNSLMPISGNYNFNYGQETSASSSISSSCFLDEVVRLAPENIPDPAEMKAAMSSKAGGKRASAAGKKSPAILIKGQWTDEEDRKLVRLVMEYGERKWAQIAEKLDGRAGKQCRERWHNHLRPDIKKDGWSEEEERVLVETHAKVGNKWAEIAKWIPGRTENSIKNHWNATKRRQNNLNSGRKHKSQSNSKNSNHLHNQSKPSKKPPQSSILQDYIKSHQNPTITPNSSTTAAAVATFAGDPPPRQIINYFFQHPSHDHHDQYSTSIDNINSPSLIPEEPDEELLYLQNLFFNLESADDHLPEQQHYSTEKDDTNYHYISDPVSFTSPLDLYLTKNNTFSFGSSTSAATDTNHHQNPKTLPAHQDENNHNFRASTHYSSSNHNSSDLYLSYLLNEVAEPPSYCSNSMGVEMKVDDDHHDEEQQGIISNGRREMDLIEMITSSHFSH